MSGLATLSLLALSIILHELGHYISARKSAVAVSEFFIGFGPKIFSRKIANTEYGVKAILLGGYVKIPGMDADEEVTNYRDEVLGTRKQIVLQRIWKDAQDGDMKKIQLLAWLGCLD